MRPGTLFGRYKIERLLGQGAMGAAYLARQQGLDRQCVLKVIALKEGAVTPDIVERFQREARATAAISSDQVVKVYDVGSVDGTPFIAMEFVDGCALDRWLTSQKRLSPAEAGRIILDAAKGLAAAHAAEILHRDVKPANILLTRDGRAKVTDFGLAKLARPPKASTPGAPQQLTLPGTTVGTTLYMSPEQAESPETIDARSDIYALGVAFYELLVGDVPFKGDNAMAIFAEKFAFEISPPGVYNAIPPDMDVLCMEMLEPDREKRPASMEVVVRRLERALREEEGAPKPAEPAIAGIAQLFPASAQRPPDAPPPRRFGRYAIERLIGQGGMGAVYFARQLDLDRPVIVKVIRRDLAAEPEMIARLQREAIAAGQITSDHVVKVYDAGVEQGIAFIAMEYVEGTSLAEVLVKRIRLSVPEATRAAIEAARGLGAAHALGILHRDVKPSNLLVARDGHVKVADFGLAKHSALGPLTAPGVVIGSPAYSAPEQLEEKPVDARADVFALGVSWYEMLTGKLPWEGESALKVYQAREKPFVVPRVHVPSLPEAVDRACATLVALDRERRPRDMRAVVELLAPFADTARR